MAFRRGHGSNSRGGDNGLLEFIHAAVDNDVDKMEDIVHNHPELPEKYYVHGKSADKA